MDDPKPVRTLIAELQERAKELNCLYRIEELVSQPDRPLEEVFRGVVEAIPPGWQYPEVCQARVSYGNDDYETPEYQETPWVQSADLVMQDARVGRITVSYTEEMPVADSGPFLKEEAKLINTIAERLSHFILHRHLKRMFEAKISTREPEDSPSRREWQVALDMLRSTDPPLLRRVSRRMINYLAWSGIAEAQALLERSGGDPLDDVDENVPRRRAPGTSLLLEGEEAFRIATEHLGDEEILARVQKWIHEDRVNSLVAPLINEHTSWPGLYDGMRRYRLQKPEGVRLSQVTANGVRVALTRRFFSDHLGFIKVAKQELKISDFFLPLEHIIYPPEGHGKLGGKSGGLFLAARVLERARERNPAVGNIKTPMTWYVTSDAMLHFLRYNNLEEVYEQRYKEVDVVRQEYPHLVALFKSSNFPPDLIKGLALALDDFGDVPLIVRSSSLLEDRFGSAFSGKYKSLFLANRGDKRERLEALLDAISEIYASTFGPDPIQYRAEKGLLDFDEEMGIMIQEVVGRQVGPYFMPAFAGVAFTNNEMRWSPRIQRKDGLLRMVPGLGTRAVDRLADDYPILVAPGQPGLRVNASVDEMIRYSPKRIDVINLATASFETRDVQQLIRECADRYPGLQRYISIHKDGMMHRPMGLATDLEHDEIVVTFDGLINRGGFMGQLTAILDELQQALESPVDIEFAHDGEDFYLLQCRSQSHTQEEVAVVIPHNVPFEDVLFSANRYVSNGLVPDITHVVYVDPDRYNELSDRADLMEVGQAVSRLNKLLPKRQFLLMGPGRWGSRGDIKLGVRVTYSDINNTAMLIEVARKKGNYVPDLSFGTHFFQDLVESSIRYLPLYPDDIEVDFNERFLRQAPSVLPEMLPDLARLDGTVKVIDVPAATGGKVLRVLMNADLDEALGMFAQPGTPVETTEEYRAGELLVPDDYWRWRLRMAHRIAAALDADRYGVAALYLIGSVKNAAAGPGSDIDLLVHFRGDARQQELLIRWFEGWSLSLGEINYLRTGQRAEGLLDIHWVSDEDIRQRTSYAVKIGAVTDAARPLPLGGDKR